MIEEKSILLNHLDFFWEQDEERDSPKSWEKPKIGKTAFEILKKYPAIKLENVLISKEIDERARSYWKSINKKMASDSMESTLSSHVKVSDVLFKCDFNIKICFENALLIQSHIQEQQSEHLIVPKNNLYKDFLVEKKLPINPSIYYNIALYLSKTRLFNRAIKEFTRLFSKINASDLIISESFQDCGNTKGIQTFIRFDNLPLYTKKKTEKERGFIGFLDTKSFKNGPATDFINMVVDLFPLHKKQIVNEAKKMKLKIDENSLKKTAKKRKEWLKQIFINHRDWLKKKQISHNYLEQRFEVQEEIKQNCCKVVGKELLLLNLGKTKWKDQNCSLPFTKIEYFYKGDDEELREFSGELTKIFFDFLQTATDKRLEECGITLTHSRSELEDWEWVRCRSLLIEAKRLVKDVWKRILQERNIQFKETGICFLECPGSVIAKQICWVVLEYLVQKKVLFLFDPEARAEELGTLFRHWSGTWWIRY